MVVRGIGGCSVGTVLHTSASINMSSRYQNFLEHFYKKKFDHKNV